MRIKIDEPKTLAKEMKEALGMNAKKWGVDLSEDERYTFTEPDPFEAFIDDILYDESDRKMYADAFFAAFKYGFGFNYFIDFINDSNKTDDDMVRDIVRFVGLTNTKEVIAYFVFNVFRCFMSSKLPPLKVDPQKLKKFSFENEKYVQDIHKMNGDYDSIAKMIEKISVPSIVSKNFAKQLSDCERCLSEISDVKKRLNDTIKNSEENIKKITASNSKYLNDFLTDFRKIRDNCKALVDSIVLKRIEETTLNNLNAVKKEIEKRKKGKKIRTFIFVFIFVALLLGAFAFSYSFPFAISYNLQGGQLSSNTTSYTMLSGAVLENPTREGYVFAGWYDNPEFNGEPIEKIDRFSFGEKKFYASWEKMEYVVSFDYNDATDNDKVNAIKISYDEYITDLPTPVKTGYQFKGWYDVDGNQYINDVTKYLVDEDITLYAKWVANSYTISFDYTDATQNNIIKSIEVTYDKPIGDLPTPYTPLSVFVGWEYQGDLVDEKTIYKFESNIKLTAVFGQTGIKFDYNSGTEGILEKYLKESSYLGELPIPTKDGYEFEGWFDSIVGGNQYTSSSMYSTNTILTLYARWSTTITFDSLNSDSDIDTNMKVYYNNPLPTLPSPKKTNYTFQGWYSEPSGKGTHYDESDIYLESQGITLYAKWTTTIYFIDIDKSTVLTEKTITYGDYIGTLPTSTSVNGYTFDAWYFINDNGDLAKLDTAEPYVGNGNENIYPVWSKEITLEHYGANSDSISTDKINAYYGYELKDLPTLEKSTYEFIGWFDAPLDSENEFTTESIADLTTPDKIYARYQGTITFYLDVKDMTNIEQLTFLYGQNLSTYDIDMSTQEYTWDFLSNLTLAGWYSDTSFENEFSFVDKYDGTGLINVYAKYYVSAVFEYYDATGNNSVAKTNLIYGIEMSQLPNPIKKGHTFVGWFEDDLFENRVYVEDECYFTQPTTLHAKYTPNTYTITFNYNGGSGTIVSKDVVFNQQIGELPFPVVSGQVFTGWQYESGAIILSDTIYIYDSDITLVATYSTTGLKFEYNAADSELDPTKYVEINTHVGTLPTPTKQGYTFVGWYDSLEGGTLYTSSTIFTSDKIVLLYARWSANLIFDYQGATSGNEVNSYKVYFNNKINSSLPIPVKNGYTFDGWYTQTSGDGEIVTSDYVFKNDSGDLTIYAKWISTITIYDEVLENGYMELEFVYGKSIPSLPETLDYDSTGFAFAGWYTEELGNGELVSASSPYFGAGKIALYSKRIKMIELISGDEIEKIEAVKNKVLDTLPTPTKNEAIFNGWFTQQSGEGEEYTNNTIFTTNSATTLYAYWIVSELATGSGSEIDPYLIFTREQLDKLSISVNTGTNYANTYFKLACDIDMGNTLFTPIGNNGGGNYYATHTGWQFNGILDGQNYTISNLKVSVTLNSENDTYAGLFGYIGTSGVVKNIKFTNANIYSSCSQTTGTKGGAHIGIVAGINNGRIENCETSGVVYGEALKDTHIGGIAGYTFASGSMIINCINRASIDGVATRWTSHGGIVGSTNNSYIKDCINYGSIYGTLNGTTTSRYLFHGGIAGVNASVIHNCTNYGSISGSFESTTNNHTAFFGGIAGYVHDGSDSYTGTEASETTLPISGFVVNDEAMVALLYCTSTGTISTNSSDSSNYYYSAQAGIVQDIYALKIKIHTSSDFDRSHWMLSGTIDRTYGSSYTVSIAYYRFNSDGKAEKVVVYDDSTKQIIVPNNNWIIPLLLVLLSLLAVLFKLVGFRKKVSIL